MYRFPAHIKLKDASEHDSSRGFKAPSMIADEALLNDPQVRLYSRRICDPLLGKGEVMQPPAEIEICCTQIIHCSDQRRVTDWPRCLQLAQLRREPFMVPKQLFKIF